MATEPDEEPVLWSVWNKTVLERCHLVPHALGGPDSPENLVLLCGRCHRDAPDVGSADHMLWWVGDRKPWGATLRDALTDALRQAAITEAQIVGFNARVHEDPGEYVRSMRQLVAEFAVPVGGSFSAATLAACSVELVRRWSE
jgi:hypothetical protein